MPASDMQLRTHPAFSGVDAIRQRVAVRARCRQDPDHCVSLLRWLFPLGLWTAVAVGIPAVRDLASMDRRSLAPALSADGSTDYGVDYRRTCWNFGAPDTPAALKFVILLGMVGFIVEKPAAILVAWYPGTEGELYATLSFGCSLTYDEVNYSNIRLSSTLLDLDNALEASGEVHTRSLRSIEELARLYLHRQEGQVYVGASSRDIRLTGIGRVSRDEIMCDVLPAMNNNRSARWPF